MIYYMLKIIVKSYSSNKNNPKQIQNTILLYYCRLNGYSRKSRKQQF